jgi:hypothetical protein
MAHEARFQRIIGVEFSPKLAKIASEQRPFALSLEMPRIMNSRMKRCRIFQEFD